MLRSRALHFARDSYMPERMHFDSLDLRLHCNECKVDYEVEKKTFLCHDEAVN